MEEEQAISQENPGVSTPPPSSSGEELGGPEPPLPSRTSHFLRLALRWAVGLGLVFALGIALTWFAQVQPRAQRIQELEDALALSNQQVSDLQAEVNELLPIRDQRNRAELHLSLLNVLMDVATAQTLLAQDDPANAALVLEETDLKLINLRANVDASLADSVGELRERLELVLEELERDAFAAQSDLEVMRNRLLEIETGLFGE